jgi:tetratricopeptide (TPR) repeat protein
VYPNNVANAIICPACHAQNRPTWEFCARCGEPLESVPTQSVSRQDTLVEATLVDEAPPPDSGSFWLLLMVAIAIGTVVLACRDIATQPPPSPPTPGVFAFGGPTPSASPAAPAVATNADVEEARRLIGQNNLAQAIPLLQKAVGENPGNGEYQHLLGRALWGTGDRDAALQAYSQAASLDPGAYRVEYAQALETSGRVDEAAAQLEAALAAQPGTGIIEEGLSRIYYNRGDYAKAAPLLESVAARTHDPVVMQQLAYAAEKTGDHERAIATYRQVLSAQPRADVARGQLAETLLAAGRGDEAVNVLQEGLQGEPNAPLLQRGLGSVFERSGHPAEAAAAYREYARLAPSAPDAADISERAARLEASLKGS